MKFVQTRFRYIDVHTHIYRFVEFHLEFPHFYRDHVLGKTLLL